MTSDHNWSCTQNGWWRDLQQSSITNLSPHQIEIWKKKKRKNQHEALTLTLMDGTWVLGSFYFFFFFCFFKRFSYAMSKKSTFPASYWQSGNFARAFHALSAGRPTVAAPWPRPRIKRKGVKCSKDTPTLPQSLVQMALRQFSLKNLK